MSSKYDVIKLKVCLPNEHFYILSRFQLSRMLMFCKVPELAAIKVALDVKKHFVNRGKIEVPQEELEKTLQDVMLSFGFDERHRGLMPVITAFYTERIPLVVLIAGGHRSGKTTMAQLLASRLNCNAVLNAEILNDVVNAVRPEDGEVSAKPREWRRAASSDVCHWQRQCKRAFDAVAAEVDKALKEGKVLIVEGWHLDLCLYRDYFKQGAARQRGGGIVMGVFLQASAHSGRVSRQWGQRKASRPCATQRGNTPPRSGCSETLDNEARRSVADVDTPATQVDEEALSSFQLASLEEVFGSSSATAALGRIRVAAGSHSAAEVHKSVHDSLEETVVWEVQLPTLSGLSAVADTLHAMTVDRILSTLLQSGRIEPSACAVLQSS